MANDRPTSKQVAQETISDFQGNNVYVALAKTAIKMLIRSVTSPTAIDFVVMTVFFMIPNALALAIATLSLSFQYGAEYNNTDKSSYGYTAPDSLQSQGAVCHYAASTMAAYTFEIPSYGQHVTGALPTKLSDFGQISEWFETGLVTTGDPIEVVVNGKWYPWGINATNTYTGFEQQKWSTSNISDGRGTAVIVNKPTEVPIECKFSTDIASIVENPEDQDFNAARRQNHLNRYATDPKVSVPINEQIEYIMDVHCIDSECKQRRKEDDFMFPSCYIPHGHGVYMRLGERSKYAYHIANYEVEAWEQYTDPITKQTFKKQYVGTQGNGQPTPYLIPFTLPTKIYNQNYSLQSIRSVTQQDPRMTYASQQNTKYINIGQELSCDNLRNLGLDNIDVAYKVAEQCLPVANQKVYITVNDIMYNDNEGNLSLIFRSGVKPDNEGYNAGIKSSPSFLQTVAFFILDPWFGKQEIEHYRPGSLVDVTNYKSGFIVAVRNALLRNFWFQVLRYMIFTVTITMYGYGLIIGKETLSVETLLNRGTTIGIAYFATDATNYAFIDQLVIPVYFRLIPNIFSSFYSAAMKISGIALSANNPFATFDIMIGVIFSQQTGYKILGAFIATPFFMILSIPTYMLMCVFFTNSIKCFLIMLTGIMMTGIYITILPLTFLLSLYPLTAKYNKAALNLWEKQIISSLFFLFVIMIIYGLALRFFVKMFEFGVCWSPIWQTTLFGFIPIGFYGWKSIGFNTQAFLENFMGFFLTMEVVQMNEEIAEQLSNLFGGTGVYGQGKGMVNSFIGNTIDIATGGAIGGMIAPRVTGFIRNSANIAASIITPSRMPFKAGKSSVDRIFNAPFSWAADKIGSGIKRVGREIAKSGSTAITRSFGGKTGASGRGVASAAGMPFDNRIETGASGRGVASAAGMPFGQQGNISAMQPTAFGRIMNTDSRITQINKGDIGSFQDQLNNMQLSIEQHYATGTAQEGGSVRAGGIGFDKQFEVDNALEKITERKAEGLAFETTIGEKLDTTISGPMQTTTGEGVKGFLSESHGALYDNPDAKKDEDKPETKEEKVEKMIKQAKRVRESKEKEKLKEAIEESMGYIDIMKESETDSQTFKNAAADLVEKMAEIKESSEKNGIRVEMEGFDTDKQLTKEAVQESTDKISNQMEIISMVFNRRVAKNKKEEFEEQSDKNKVGK